MSATAPVRNDLASRETTRHSHTYHHQARVVSLGLDTFAGDPIAGFTLQSEDYLRMGERLRQPGLPTVLVFEGGYAVEKVVISAVYVLQAFA